MRRRFQHAHHWLRSGLTVSALLLGTQEVLAHALEVVCKLQGEMVVVEAAYDDGTAAPRAKVRVLDAQARLIADGRTDETGHWSFPRPPSGRYQVEVDAGGGHFKKEMIEIPAGAASAREPIKISEGPTPEETARLFWPKIAVGLGAIAGFFIAIWFAKRRKQSPPPAETGREA
jgi:hypothetical protein